MVALIVLLSPTVALAHEPRLEVFPMRPFNVDLALRQSFTTDSREVALQAGLTALRYGNLEVRTIYQYFGLGSDELKSDVHSVYVNPRWNNFLDILNFPSGRPINRLLRHLLFGPLGDRVVPYVGVMGGAVLSGPGVRAPTYLYGGQGGVRFPVMHTVSLDLSVGYFAYGVDLEGHGGHERQLLFTTGLVF